MNTSNISQQVMASVFVIYVARIFFGATALKCYALVAAVWGIGRLVWVSKVFENFLVVEQSGIGSIGKFILAAIEHAHIGVQFALAVIILAAASLLFDLGRTSRSARLAA